MANKSMKPMKINPLAPSIPAMTDEEKRAKIMQFLQQKREQFSINILCHSVRGEAFLNAEEGVKIVDTAVAMADHLLEKLYPIKEEESK